MFYFSFLHFPLSGPVLTNISLPIIPCMIVYVTNNKEPWTLNLDVWLLTHVHCQNKRYKNGHFYGLAVKNLYF